MDTHFSRIEPLYFLIFILFHPPAISNNPFLPTVTTNSNVPVNELVMDELLGKDCYEVSNINFTGNAQAIGTFSGGVTSLGMENGVILSTGKVISAQGPNSSNGIGSSFSMISNDADLQTLVGTGTVIRDLAMLEFDFVPTENTVTFEYVFASEEYCEHIDLFNDAFGFFISGNGINGSFSNNSVNIATLPNGQPISVSNVNHINNSSYYIGNVPTNSSQLNDPDCNGHPDPIGNSINEIEFDGYTVKMTATVSVIPCETYHLKIAIVDAEDGIYDSAIFLRANSFDAGGSATVEAINPANNSNQIQEGCESGYFLFSRLNEDTSQPINLTYNILPSSSADAGLDFQNLTGSITIPSGQMAVQLPVTIFADELLEGNETIDLELLDACQCNPIPVQVIILDTPPIEISLADVSLCANENATLSPTISGGMPPYSFLWSNNSTNQNLNINPSQTSTYHLTVIDNCGVVKTKSVVANVISEPTAQLSGIVQVCNSPTPSGNLNIITTGTGPWEIGYNLDGIAQSNLTVNTQNFDWQVSQNGTYELTSITDLGTGCTGTVSGTGTLQISNFELSISVENITCFGVNDGKISISPNGGTVPFSYSWDHNISGANPHNLNAGFYNVTVTDSNSCTAVEYFQITQPAEILATATASQSANCANPNGGAIDLQISGGNGNFTFQWNNGAETNQNPENLSVGIYQVTATDSEGCTATTSAEILGDFNVPNAQIEAPEILDCNQSFVLLNASNSSSGNNFSYEWTTQNGMIQSGENTPFPTVVSAGNYDLVVTNLTNGCTATASTNVEAEDPIFASISNPENLDCNITEITLSGNTNASGNNLIFAWQTNEGNILSGGNTLNPIVNQSGSYQLTINDLESGCSAETNVFVEANLEVPSIGIQNPETLNCTQNSIQIEAEISNNLNQISFEWMTQNGQILNGQNSLSPTINQAGFYEISVTNLENGCTNSESIEVTENVEIPEIILLELDTLNCAQNFVDFQPFTNLVANFEFELKDENNNVLNAQNLNNWQIENAGNYFLTLTNLENGCSADTSFFISENVEIPELELAQNASLNCQNPEIQMSILTNLNNNFETIWQVNNDNFAYGENEITTSLSGIYNIVLINLENGCSNSESLEIIADFEQPTVEIEIPEMLTCNQNSVSLLTNIDTSNFEVIWLDFNGNILNNVNENTANANSAGWYFLEILNPDNGCSNLDSVEVLADASIPELQIFAADTLTCNQTEITLIAELENPENYDLTWTTFDGNILENENSLNPTVNQAGKYFLIVINIENGCTVQDSVLIAQNGNFPEILVVPFDTINCYQNSVILNGENSEIGDQFSYEWKNEIGEIISNEITAEVSEIGIYCFTISNLENGCFSSEVVEIYENLNTPNIEVNTLDTINCYQNSVILNGENSETGDHFSYEWKNETEEIISNEMTAEVGEKGEYFFTIFDLENGCSFTEIVQVLEDLIAPEIMELSAENLSCTNQEIEIHSTISGENLIFNWESPDGNILNETDVQNALVNASGNYFVTVLNLANGCSDSSQIEVLENIETPDFSIIEPAKLTCRDSIVEIESVLNSGLQSIDYQWNAIIGNIISEENNGQILVDEIGSYELRIINTENGCSANQTIEVFENLEIPEIQLPETAVIECSVEFIQIGAIVSGQEDLLIQWLYNNQILEDAHQLNLFVSEPGNFKIIVENLENGCQNSALTEIIESEGFEANYEVVQPNCDWQFGSVFFENNDSISYLYSIDDGANFSTHNNFENLEAGMYEAIVQSEFGCEFQAQIQIDHFTEPELQLEKQFPIEFGENIEFQPVINFNEDNIETIIWSNSETLSCQGCLNPIAYPTKNTLYELTIFTKDGCELNTEILIRVDKRLQIFAPNVFSPNNDGKNDFFYLQAPENTVKNVRKFVVFDRWGNQVFANYDFPINEASGGWNGKFKGGKMDADVYLWMAKLELVDGREETISGSVSLL